MVGCLEKHTENDVPRIDDEPRDQERDGKTREEHVAADLGPAVALGFRRVIEHLTTTRHIAKIQEGR